MKPGNRFLTIMQSYAGVKSVMVLIPSRLRLDAVLTDEKRHSSLRKESPF